MKIRQLAEIDRLPPQAQAHYRSAERDGGAVEVHVATLDEVDLAGWSIVINGRPQATIVVLWLAGRAWLSSRVIPREDGWVEAADVEEAVRCYLAGDAHNWGPCR